MEVSSLIERKGAIFFKINTVLSRKKIKDFKNYDNSNFISFYQIL